LLPKTPKPQVIFGEINYNCNLTQGYFESRLCRKVAAVFYYYLRKLLSLIVKKF